MAERRSIKEIFGEAVELPATERAAFLDRACGGDAVMRAEIEALLRVHGSAGAFLAAPTQAGSGRGADEPAARAPSGGAALGERAGAVIGRYRLLEPIGEGGFGVVFMAEQREPVVRRVALKIIKLGMDTRQVIARFEAERQALALMDHPNIAKVLDGGATESGRPYFVMELVKGEPITAWCDRNMLGPRERLELFVPVCHAVQHAHQKGIIHRDLKPSNVLVALIDGKPVPKVIDFGVAKATGAGRLTEKTLFTEFRQLVGTPEYMSPEQAAGVDIDTRSDVYALGVLLYELLTGTPPFDAKRLRSAAWDEMLRIIREEDPRKPSTRLSGMRETVASVAAQRQVEPGRLARLLQGDLDWIAMKCLEKDRARRYETANGLAMDVQRHLAGEAVAAAPPSRVYRARKFVRRNRGPVAAAGLVVLVLVLGVIGTSWGMVWALGERALAETARQGEAAQKRVAVENGAKAEASAQVARAEASRARAALEVVKEVLTPPDEPGVGQPLGDPEEAVPSIFVRRLEEFSRAWGFQEAADPVVEAEVRLIVGRSMRMAGLARGAMKQFQRSYEVCRQLHGELHAQTNTAMAAWLEAMLASGDKAGAVRCAKEAEERARAEDKRDEFEFAERLHHLGNIWMWAEDYANAERAARECHDARERSGNTQSQRYADDYCLIGSVAVCRRDWRAAEAAFLQAVELNRRITGELSEGVDWPSRRLAGIYGRMGDPARVAIEARASAERGRRALTERSTPAEKLRLAERMDRLCLAAANVDALDEAETAARDAVALRLEDPQRDLRGLSRAVFVVGYTCWIRGNDAEAERWLRECLNPKPEHTPDGTGWTAQSRGVLGIILADRGELEEAEALTRASNAGNKNVANHWTHWLGNYQLALICRRLGRTAEAEELERAAEGKDLRGMVRGLGTSLRVARVGAELARQGMHAKAERFLFEHEATMRGLFPEGWRRFDAASQLGACYAAQSLFTKGEPLVAGSAERLTASAGAPRAHVIAAVERAVAMYEAWETAEPGRGYGEKAAAWRATLAGASGG